MKKLLSENEALVLKRPLPSCPKGRILRKDKNGDFFVSTTDDELISGEIKMYKFHKDEINKNPNWFMAPKK